MSADMIFQTATAVAVVGWLVLLATPFAPTLAQRVSGLAIPLLLSIAYAGLILAYWSSGQGGFDSLDNVALLFQTRELLLAGWIHYLAFDLFVGAWIARTARAEGVAFWLAVPCMFLTFMFGPVGFLVFNALRTTRLTARAAATA